MVSTQTRDINMCGDTKHTLSSHAATSFGSRSSLIELVAVEQDSDQMRELRLVQQQGTEVLESRGDLQAVVAQVQQLERRRAGRRAAGKDLAQLDTLRSSLNDRSTYRDCGSLNRVLARLSQRSSWRWDKYCRRRVAE